MNSERNIKSRWRWFGLMALVAICAGCSSEITLSVPDMMCEESCAVKVREVLSKQDGVKRVDVDFSSRTATLRVSSSAFDADRAIAALVDHGFEEARVKTSHSPMPAPSTPPISDAVAQPVTSASEINL